MATFVFYLYSRRVAFRFDVSVVGLDGLYWMIGPYHRAIAPVVTFCFVSFLLLGLSNFFFCIIFGWCSSPMFSRRAVANDGEADAENGTSGLRRACSLSDLSKPSPRRLLPSPPNNGITSIQFFFVFVFFSNCSAFFGIKTQWVKLKFWFPGDILEVSIVFFFFCFFYCEILCLCALACRRVQSTDFELFSYVVDHYFKGFSGQLSFIFRMDLF